MKKTFLFLILLLPIFGFSQTGTNQRISSTNANTNFRTLQGAITYLRNNGGISQSITLFIDENQEVATPIVIQNIPGTSATNTLTIKNGNASEISGSINDGAIFQLNAAKYIIIDGLTVYNKSTTAQTSKAAIWIYSTSAYNKFQNLTLKQNINDINVGRLSAGILASSNSFGQEGNNPNNEVSNVTFTGVKQAIYVNGNSAANSNWTIENCTIGSQTDATKPIIGIYLNNVDTYKINGNTINGVRRSSGSDNPKHGGIYIEGANSRNGEISKNKINDINNNTDNFGAAGIYVTGGTTKVFNNFISNVRAIGSYGIPQNGYGIHLNSGSDIKLYFNTVNMVANQNMGFSAALYISSSTSQLDIRNNIFNNLQTSGSLRFAVYSENTSTSNFTNINYNNYKSTEYLGTWGSHYNSSNIKNSLSQWSSVTGKDANSKELSPSFISNTDLHLTKPNITNNNLKGIAIATYTNDIDEDTRLSTPTMGADEYLTCTSLTAPTGIVKSATTSCVNGNSVLLTAQGGTPAGTVYQWGTGTVTSANAIAGQTGATITVSPNVSTTYWVRRFSNDACATYSSEASTVVVPSDKTIFGNGQWIGYVYSKYTNATTTPPAADDNNYQGYVTENAIFDTNVGEGVIRGGTGTYLCEAPFENFFVRYKMRLNLPAGAYNFTVGGDDGFRLFIDGVQTTINDWSQHNYTTGSATRNFATAGPHDFVIEYYDGPGISHVSFNYSKIEGDPTVFGNNVWNVYGYGIENINVDANNASYAGYFVDPALGINSEDRWPNGSSPSAAVAVPSGGTAWSGGTIGPDNFTVVHKRKGFPCGLYEVKIDKFDDEVKVILDGNVIFERNGYSPNANVTVGNFNLNADSKMEVRLREGGGAAYVKMTLTNKPATYNNGAWDTDPANKTVVINSNLTVATDLTVCSCTVKAGKKVTVNSDKALNVIENVIVETGGNIYVKNNGSFVQVRDNATFTGDVNSFTMDRNTTSMILYDYTYWGSPVAAQNLLTFSPKTSTSKFYSFDGTNWANENPSTTNMTPGRGYIIRGPQGWNNTITNGGYSSNSNPSSATPLNANGSFDGGVFQGVFIGKANAGDINVQLLGSAGSSNLFGNPYASAISTQEFMNANAGKTDGNFYFWTHKTPMSRIPDANGHLNYADSDYTMLNKTGGTQTNPIAAKPTASIAAGQGFFVNTKAAAGTNIVFKNSMRLQGGGRNGEFYRTSSNTQNDRYWISISNGTAYNEFLVGYVEGATNALEDNYDGISYSGGNAKLYTVIDGKKLAIQGREYPFNNSDVVPVGYKTAAAGQFTISINKKEGVFENGQAIYLYDKTTNEYHDLTAGDYVFNADAGTFDTRFEMRYTNETLGIDTPVVTNNDIIVYKTGNQIAVKAKNFTIDGVQVYDITGKNLYAKKGIDNSEFNTSGLNIATQVVVVKVTLDGGQTVTKKVIMN